MKVTLAKPGFVSHLVCLAIAAQPLMVSSVAAKCATDKKAVHAVTEEVVSGKPYSVSRTVIKAAPEKVWSVLSDYSNAPTVFPQLKHCQVIEDRGATKIVKHIIEPTGLPGRYKYVIELKETAPKMMEWHRISGDFKEVDGVWKLEPLDGGHSTLVTYSAHVNGGLFIPQALIKRQFRVDMPNVMSSLKEQSEHSGVEIAGRPSPTRSQ